MNVENCVGNVWSENNFVIMNHSVKFLSSFDVVGCSDASHLILESASFFVF